ncbi:MAG: hypothetical protein H6739_10810 [Alphaproteobacteria bacterium]|nr:hypothetical protein [Alphaproteobacteria bacterium]
MTLLLAITTGCTPPPPSDLFGVDTAPEVEVTVPDAHSLALMLTEGEAGAVGLSALDLDAATWTEDVLTLNADAWLTVLEGRALVVEGDRVRLFLPGMWDTPLAEWMMDEGDAPVAAAVCRDQLFLALYGRAALSVHDLDDGRRLGLVNLSDVADADGLPEPTSLAVVRNRLFLGLGNEDRFGGDVLGGQVVEVDCRGRVALGGWPTDAPATVASIPLDPSRLMVIDSNPDGDPDGGLRFIDLDEGWLSDPRLFEGLLRQELVGMTPNGAHAVVRTRDPLGADGLACLGLRDYAWTPLFNSPQDLVSAAANDRGEVWVVARAREGVPSSRSEVFTVQTETCSMGAPALLPSRPPLSVAFY